MGKARNLANLQPSSAGQIETNDIQDLAVTPAKMSQKLTHTMAVTASGTAVDFTGIPSWVKRITVMFNGVSTNSTSNRRVQLGSGSVQTTSYSCVFGYATTAVAPLTSTSGFDIVNGSAAEVLSGHIVFTNISGNVWVASAVITTSGATAGLYYCGGNVTLSGTLDRIRITTANGTDVFDAGTINIMYEG